jgi:hypothetical protein
MKKESQAPIMCSHPKAQHFRSTIQAYFLLPPLFFPLFMKMFIAMGKTLHVSAMPMISVPKPISAGLEYLKPS